MAILLSKQQFIDKANLVHDSFYDYSLVEYKNSRTKVTIICPKHGNFEQTARGHLSGKRCIKCSKQYGALTNKRNKKYSTEEFIAKSKLIHKNYFTYHNTIYVNYHTKICVTCPKHGDYWTFPGDHLRGCGCSKCKNMYKYTTEEYITECNRVHNNFYDYKECNYINYYNKVLIDCPVHGNFQQRAGDHIRGNGCSECGGSVLYTNEKFIAKANEIHKNKYTYPNLKYKNSQTKIEICCPKHGIFKQRPASHLYGYGCSRCFESEGEKEINKFLKTNNIKFKSQHRFVNCKSILQKGNQLPFDFYLQKYSIAIEYDGQQHYRPTQIRGVNIERANEIFERTKINDQIKTDYCKSNDIKLLRIPYTEFKKIEKILKDVLIKGIEPVINYPKVQSN